MAYPYPQPRPITGATPGTTLRRTGVMNREGYADGPIVWDSELGGCIRPVADITERNSILPGFRRQGMLVITLLAPIHIYILGIGLTNADWIDLGSPHIDGWGPGAGGAPGAAGSVWRYGTTVPDNALGANGDFYLRTTTGGVYYRAAGVYTLVFTMGTGGGSGPLSDIIPQPTGVASAGAYSESARADHIHALGDFDLNYPSRTKARMNLAILR